MDDNEKQQIAQAEQEIIAELRNIESLIARTKLLRAERLALLSTMQPHKVHGLTKRAYWVSLGYKPSSVSNEIAVLERFGKYDLVSLVKSRLVNLLSHKFDNQDIEQEWIGKWCGPDTSHEHWLSAFAELKGITDPLSCQCHDLIFLTKCKTCGKTKRDALNP